MWWRAVLVCLVAARADGAALEGDLAELAKMVRDTCIEDTGVDSALLEQVDDGADLMDDGTFKCYIKCTMEMGGMISDDEVDVDAVLDLLPPEMVVLNESTLRKCGTQKGDDECDTAYRTQQCWQENNRANYFLI